VPHTFALSYTSMPAVYRESVAAAAAAAAELRKNAKYSDIIDGDVDIVPFVIETPSVWGDRAGTDLGGEGRSMDGGS